MQIFFLKCFIFFCNGNISNTRRFNRHFESGTVLSNTLIEEVPLHELMRTSVLMMISRENITTKKYKDLRDKQLEMNITNILGLLYDHLITIEKTRDVVKFFTTENSTNASPNFGPNFTNGICLCSNYEFSSVFVIANNGFNKLKNYILVLMSSLEGSNHLTKTDMDKIFQKCELLILHHSPYLISLLKYWVNLQETGFTELILSKDLQYKIFLRQKFCCLINTFVKLLDHLICCFKKNNIHIEQCDFNADISQLILAKSLVNATDYDENYTLDQLVEDRIDIYHLLHQINAPTEANMLCLGALLNLKLEEWKLKDFLEENRNTKISIIDEYSVAAFKKFVQSKNLCSLEVFYEEYLVTRIKIMETIYAKMDDPDTDDKTLKEFIFSKTESLLNPFDKSQISECLKLTYSCIYFAQEFVLSKLKNDLNIFLGFAFDRLSFLIIIINECDPLYKLRNSCIELLGVDNSAQGSQIRISMKETLKRYTKVYQKYKQICDFLNLGWFKNKENDATSETGKSMEQKIIEFMGSSMFQQ